MKLKIFLITIITLTMSYFVVNSLINKDKFLNLKLLLSSENRFLIKKYIFPYNYISQLEKKIINTKSTGPVTEVMFALKKELDFKKNLADFQIQRSKIVKLSNNMIMDKHKLINGFYVGINNTIPGTGYIDFHQNNMLVLSARGVLGYSEYENDKLNFKQIKNNINFFIDIKQFSKSNWFSLKDLLIHKDQIFVSYTEEIKDNCWNTSVISGNMNYEIIEFEKIFSKKDCVHSIKNIDKEFNAHQSGGRIINYDNNHILLSTGDYRSRFLAQDRNSVNGKIVKINVNNYEHEIVSMGHRNPQGLYFDKENNFILETEHGPKGGDEINLIQVDKINKDNPLNYGWPVVSAGEHYSGKSDKKKYKKYPLYKSHSKYSFIEPLKSFVPSIGISEITKIKENMYVASSLKDESLYFFELNNEKKMINLERVEVHERVRDLKFNSNNLYLFLEDTPSIGVISFN
jgi:hypothetical protein